MPARAASLITGAWRRMPWLVLAAVVLELTSIVSFAVGPYYLVFVTPALAITWILTAIFRRSVSSSPASTRT